MSTQAHGRSAECDHDFLRFSAINQQFLKQFSWSPSAFLQDCSSLVFLFPLFSQRFKPSGSSKSIQIRIANPCFWDPRHNFLMTHQCFQSGNRQSWHEKPSSSSVPSVFSGRQNNKTSAKLLQHLQILRSWGVDCEMVNGISAEKQRHSLSLSLSLSFSLSLSLSLSHPSD